MESKAAELLAALKNNNFSIDTKVGHLVGIKSDIKQKNVPEGAVLPIFDSLRLAIASQHSSLAGAGFSTLGHFLKRLYIQEQHNLVSIQGRILFPLLLERLGDHKERVRAQAAQAFTDLWPAANADVEHYVLDLALGGKNTRSKEMAMFWLSNMTKSHGLLFRPYVSSLVAGLEDADSAVRNTAKSTVIELFLNAPARAKSDLQRQLAAHDVRKSIVNVILGNIGLGSPDSELPSTSRPVSRVENRHQRPVSRASQRPVSRAETNSHRPVSRAETLSQRPVSRAEIIHIRPVPPQVDTVTRVENLHQPLSHVEILPQRPISVPSGRPHHHDDLSNEVDLGPEPTKSRPGSSKSEQDRTAGMPSGAGDVLPQASAPRPISQEGEKVEPLYITSYREIEDMVRDMLPCFEGKESEDNWSRREKNVLILRRLTHGNAPDMFPQQFLTGMKTLLDGIFKVVNSLRTTLCTNGCLLIQDFARKCGPKIDPMVEIIMQNLMKLCGGMKKISAQNGNSTVEAMIENVTYTPRILQHVLGAFQDKGAQLRLFATAWLKTLIIKQAHHRSVLEHNGGLETIEKCIKKTLADANSNVREATRSTFWSFYHVWPDRANDILSDLDNKTRGLLEKDPSNPNVQSKNSTASRKGVSSNTAVKSRSTLKDVIAAQKKAYLSPAKIPHRPESAQSTFGEVKSSDFSPKPSAVRTVPTGAPISSLSSAPMRPAVRPRRPELARPATADPYASRRHVVMDSHVKGASGTDGSPRASKSKSSTPSSKLQPKQKADPVHISGTTRDRPKRLVIPKTRLNDPHATNTNKTRPRNNSNESMPYRSPDRNHFPITVDTFDIPNSPISVLSERVPALDDLVLSRDNISIQNFQSIPSEKPNELSNAPGLDVNDFVQNPGNILSNATTSKQTETVTIYEDPVLPTSTVSESLSRIVLHDEDVRQESENIVTSWVDTQDVTAPPLIHERELAYLTGADSSVFSAQDLPKPIAQEHEGTAPLSGTPAPITVADLVSSTEPSSPMIPTGLARANNNEDITAHSTESSNLFLANQSSSKQDALEEIPSNEPAQTPSQSATQHQITVMDPLAASEPSSSLIQSGLNNDENKAVLTSKHTSLSLPNRSVSKHNILEELPSDEPAHRDNKPARHIEAKYQIGATIPVNERSRRRWRKVEAAERRRSISPRSKDPVKAREMLEKGVRQIHSKTMDILGYRKLQGLIEYHDSIFSDEGKYDEMLLALFDELESPPDEKRQPLGRPLDLKTQVLLTIRFMFNYNKLYFSAYYPRAMSALILARRHYDANCHIVSGLEETADDIISVCEPSDVVEAVLDVIITEEKDEGGYRAVLMGITVLTRILGRVNASKANLPEASMERLGQFAASLLTDRQPDVRRLVVQLCVQLHGMATNDEHFWKMVGRPRENSRNLLTYYIAKK